ncbi:Ras-related protein Rab-21 [Halotydeus destructor]|nr:Ras-related protein Rab-21 [Halotydeus destructor]
MSQRGVQSHQFKIVLLGEGCVGKTSLVLRYVENKFNEAHNSTLQASFVRKNLVINGVRITLNIWDTAGQERFHALGPIYYRDSNGALLVYDVTDPDSLEKVKTWVKELRKMLGNTVCIAIVGNKLDLLTAREQSAPNMNALVSDALEYTSAIGNAVHYTTSAKANRGIDEMYLDLTKRMVEYQQQNVRTSSTRETGRLVIADDEPEAGDGPNTERNKCAC